MSGSLGDGHAGDQDGVRNRRRFLVLDVVDPHLPPGSPTPGPDDVRPADAGHVGHPRGVRDRGVHVADPGVEPGQSNADSPSARPALPAGPFGGTAAFGVGGGNAERLAGTLGMPGGRTSASGGSREVSSSRGRGQWSDPIGSRESPRGDGPASLSTSRYGGPCPARRVRASESKGVAVTHLEPRDSRRAFARDSPQSSNDPRQVRFRALPTRRRSRSTSPRSPTTSRRRRRTSPSENPRSPRFARDAALFERDLPPSATRNPQFERERPPLATRNPQFERERPPLATRNPQFERERPPLATRNPQFERERPPSATRNPQFERERPPPQSRWNPRSAGFTPPGTCDSTPHGRSNADRAAVVRADRSARSGADSRFAADTNPRDQNSGTSLPSPYTCFEPIRSAARSASRHAYGSPWLFVRFRQRLERRGLLEGAGAARGPRGEPASRRLRVGKPAVPDPAPPAPAARSRPTRSPPPARPPRRAKRGTSPAGRPRCSMPRRPATVPRTPGRGTACTGSASRTPSPRTPPTSRRRRARGG
jgi:hypothetical protein